MSSLILGIETSCDECSAAVLEHHPHEGLLRVKSLETYTQIALHEPYGGVVPEVASRSHLETLPQVLNRALLKAGISASDLNAIAVTNRPGLVGALLVGVSSAKALAYALKTPLIPVHHLEGHLASAWIENSEPLPLPAIALVVSGGHTNLYRIDQDPSQWPVDFLSRSCLGRSRDDAAGEAFDKTAKLLGFPYPGGMYIDRASSGGDPRAFAFPRALPQKDTLDFSFSGLKTAAAQKINELKHSGALEQQRRDLCASLQDAIVGALIAKSKLAIERTGAKSFILVGGVAANSRLRERLGAEISCTLRIASRQYCTDNAAMIAAAGALRFAQGHGLKGNALLQLNAWAQAAC
jgi:N6-L-threonylcarbamoyladenine synthase